MRAFIALEIPQAARRAIAQRIAGIRPRQPEARWVDEGAYHLTLLFLGEIGEDEVSGVQHRLHPVFRARRRLTIQLSAAGTFPPGRPARVAWVGVEAPDRIVELAHAARRAASGLVGSDESRLFTPHVTVARCRRPWPRSAAEHWRSAFGGRIAEPFVVNRGVLMRSRLEKTGACYDVVTELPFGPG